jgi:heat-inducible transcriptional repressor
MLTPRQEQILCQVVEGYLSTGQPVGSRTIAAAGELDCGPSTIRNELALLEEHGLLAHPHTSAGRIPTDAGQRYVVDLTLASGPVAIPAPRLELSLVRREVEDAMHVATESLSRMTNLLAVISAPSVEAATIRHVEVLALHPDIAMVLIITATGNVAKTLVAVEEPLDPGLVAWAKEYLNERVVGLELGARMVHQRLLDPGLTTTERDFLDRLLPAFAGDLASASEDTIYVGGTARLLASPELDGVSELNEVMSMLERRVALLRVLRAAISERDIYVRIGSENELPAMRSLALVAAGYGMARRPLGTVSVIGPVRMDYAGVIGTVREVAHELSRFVEDAYAER